MHARREHLSRWGVVVWGALAAFFLILPSPAPGGVVPLGSEFQVNTYTTGNQGTYLGLGVAGDSDGNLVVVWNSGGQDGSSYGVFGQRFDSAGGLVGTEFQVNTYTVGFQWFPSVARDPSGSFVVVWEGDWTADQDGDLSGVFAQRYDSNGTPVGTEFQVNTYTVGLQGYPRIACDPSGNFVVVWESGGVPGGQDGSAYGVFAQRYDSNGTPVGTEFQLNTYTTGNQFRPVVVSETSGNFVVVWDSYGQDGSDRGIFARRYDSTGTPVGAEFQVNTYTAGDQRFYSAAVSSDASGNFVVVWDSYGQDGSYGGVFAQRYDSAGAPLGTEFQVNTYTTSYQVPTGVASDPSGNFVVVWDSYGQDGYYDGVFAQRYDSAGVPLGTEFQVNTYTTYGQMGAQVAAWDSGSFVVVWKSSQDGGYGAGVFAQRFGLACDPTPVTGCRTAGKSVLVVRDKTPDTRDKLVWKWLRGAAATFSELGDPVSGGTSYLVCLYDESSGTPSLAWSAVVGPDGTCANNKPCWKQVGSMSNPRGYRYKDRDAATDGIKKLLVKAGDAGRAKAIVVGKGVNLNLPGPVGSTYFNQDANVTLQLVKGDGSVCWEGVYPAAAIRNQADLFKDKCGAGSEPPC